MNAATPQEQNPHSSASVQVLRYATEETAPGRAFHYGVSPLHLASFLGLERVVSGFIYLKGRAPASMLIADVCSISRP